MRITNSQLVLIFLVLILISILISISVQIVQATTIYPAAKFSPEDTNWTFNFTESQEGEFYCNSTHCEFRNTGLNNSDFVVGESGDINMVSDGNNFLALTNFSESLVEFRAYRSQETDYSFKVQSSASFSLYRDGNLQKSVDANSNGMLQFSQGGEGWYNYRITTNDSGEPPILSNAQANPITVLNDNGRTKPSGTLTSKLQVEVTDDSGVQSVSIDLSPVGGSVKEMTAQGNNYFINTTATAGINETHHLTVTATDNDGNTNTTTIDLTVLRRGDVFRDNRVDMKDAVYIARYLADLEPEASNPPPDLVGDVVGSKGDPGGDGEVDMKDAVYIARYKAGYEAMP